MKQIDSIYQIVQYISFIPSLCAQQNESKIAVDISQSMSDTTENQNDKTIQDQKLIPLKQIVNIPTPEFKPDKRKKHSIIFTSTSAKLALEEKE